MNNVNGVRGVLLRKSRHINWQLPAIFLFLTITISISMNIYYQQQKNAVILEQTKQLKAITDLKAIQIRDWLWERMGDARLIQQNPIMTAELAAYLDDRSIAGGRSSIQHWMESMCNEYHYENMLLLDRQGEVVLSANPRYANIGSAGSKTIGIVRRSRDTALSDLHRSPDVPHIHMDVVTPVLAKNEIAGFVFLRINPADFLYPMVQSWPTPSPSAETLLVKRDGKEVLFLNELRHRRNTALTFRLSIHDSGLPAAQATAGKTGVMFGRDYRGVAVWSVSRSIPGTSWFIVAKIDREEIEHPIRRSALAVLLVTLFLILSAALSILFLWQRQNAQFHLRQLEAQRESEENFRQVFETANVGKSITRLSGEINVNQAFCEMLGYSHDELRHRKWQELTPADEIASIQAKLEPLLSGEKNAIRFDKSYIHKNGSIVWGDVNVVIKRDPAGKPLHFITTVVDISERKRAEAQLRHALERIRQIIDANVIGVVIADAAGRIIESNDYYLKLIGYSRAEFEKGLVNWRALTPPEWLPADEKAIGELRARGKCAPYEKEYSRRDGTRVPVYLADALLSGAEEHIVAFAIDLSERKQAEAALRQSEKRLRETQEMAHLGHWQWDVRTGAVEWSEEVYRIFQLDPSTFTPRIDSILALSPWPEDHRRDEELIRRAMADHEQGAYEQRFLRPDGSIGHYHSTFQGLYDSQGGLHTIIGTVLDISERKRAEQEFVNLSMRNQALLEAIPDIIMEVDKNKVYTWVNHAGIEFFGDDVIGKQASYYFEGEQQTYLQVKPIFNGQEGVIYIESWQRRRDGQKRLLAWWCRVLKDVDGQVSGALSSARDITEIKLAENEVRRLNEELEQRVLQRTSQLQAANKELEAFSYSVSHDLRAPLRAIDGFSRIVLEDYSAKLDAEGRRLLNVIGANTQKMGRLIDDLLAFSRLSRQQMAFAAVDMAGLAKAVFAELRGQENQRRIEFKVSAPPAACGDRSLLRQVLQNLLANAVKFTRAKKQARIEFGGRTEKTEHVYFVRDNGVGFDMKYADKLFGVFQRLHGSSEFEGTGVGLAIVQRIIVRHGGRAWAEGEEGKGAAFYFALPVMPADAAAPGAARPGHARAKK